MQLKKLSFMGSLLDTRRSLDAFMCVTGSSYQPYDIRRSIDIVMMKNQNNSNPLPPEPREGNVLIQGHTAGQSQTQEENAGLLSHDFASHQTPQNPKILPTPQMVPCEPEDALGQAGSS